MNEMKFIDSFTVEHTSKYFGNITFSSYDGYWIVDVKYNDQDLYIMLPEHIIPNDENNLKICFSLIDKYAEIVQIVKDVIKNHSQKNIGIIGLNSHNDFQNIQTMVNNIYPDLFFEEDRDNKITIDIWYPVSKKYHSNVFMVKMDQKLNIERFEYDYTRQK
jgi:hypothetical protein